MRYRARVVIMVAIAGIVQLCTSALPATATPNSGSTQVVPTQLIAKTHTEVLGRLPSPAEWQNAVAAFEASGCSAATVRAFVRNAFLSAEYAGRGYGNAASLLTLYRGALNREPDPDGYAYHLGLLDGGTSWTAVVDAVLAATEFTDVLVPKICGTNATYGWGTTPAMVIPTSGTGFTGGTGGDLQALLNATPPGGTVWLAQQAVVKVHGTIVIPSGVTLATIGLPGPSRYASQGRLVREALMVSEMVRLAPGARLDSVWVDGQRSAIVRVSGQGQPAIDVSVLGGTVVNNTLSGSAGWTTMQLGTADGSVCDAHVAGNLVTSYASLHQGDFSDGISSYCDSGVIENNGVVDTTDVGIILFAPSSGGRQRTEVRFNTVLSAGNSGYGAYAVDGTTGKSQPPDFTGSSVHDNVFWSGGRTHVDIGLAVGTRAWFGSLSSTGIGASFTNNSTGGLVTRVGAGVAVAGMLGVTVTGNVLQVSFADEASPCPQAVVGASVSAGYASGTIQQPYTDALYESCINGN
jgi:hypothetical protein